jgi:hypothetical protein
MRKLRFGLAGVMLALLSGCGNFPPAAGDPFKGILAQPPKDAQQKTIPDASSRSLAIMLSDNTEASFKWLIGTMDRNAGTAFEQLTQMWHPKNFADRIAGILKKHFADVQVVSDMNEVQRARADYAAVIDVTFSLIPTGLGEYETYTFQAHFLNRAAERIAVAEGKYGSSNNYLGQCGVSHACIAKYQATKSVEMMDQTCDAFDKSVAQVTRK